MNPYRTPDPVPPVLFAASAAPEVTPPRQLVLIKDAAGISPPAHDSREIAHCSLAVSVKKLDLDARTVDVVMSTPTIDRHGERVELDWDLRAYAANPVVLWAHDSRELPLGRCENVRIDGNALVGTIRFCSAAANPKAEQCLQLFREGVLNAVSVGFIPHSYRFEKDDDEEILVLSQNELVELSVTPTPANPDALARRRAKAMAKRTKDEVSEGGASPPALSVDIHAKNPPELRAPFQSLIESAKSATESSMDLKEATEKLEKSEKALIDAKANEKALTDRAEKVEKALAERDSQIEALKTEKAAYETQKKTLVDERDAEKKKVSDLEAKLFENEVDALVGKKIKPTEKATFLKLLKQDRTLFDEMIAERSEMKLDESVTESGKKSGAPPAVGDTSELLAEFNDD
jgi:HK97 family phage prohead protease